MTSIEDLVREALASTPVAAPTTDPFVGLEQRIRRARRRLAAAAGVAAIALAAAVVVPLALVGGQGSQRIKVAVTPTPSPSGPPGTTVLWDSGAVWVSTDSDGQRWLLFTDGSADNNEFVGHVVPGGGIDSRVPVELPADYVVAGDNYVWVIGGGDGGANMSRLTAIDIHTSHAVTLPFPSTLLSNAAVVGDSLYVDATDASGSAVDRVDVTNGAVTVTASKPVPAAAELVATKAGKLWVHSGKKLVELTPTAGGFDVTTAVSWGTGEMYAAQRRAGGDANGVWAYDGDRLIQLSPANLAGCVSCAEGDRVSVQGRPTGVVEDPDGGLFVAIADADRIDAYTPAALGQGDTPVSASLEGEHVITMVGDPAGGVQFVDDQGRLISWDP